MMQPKQGFISYIDVLIQPSSFQRLQPAGSLIHGKDKNCVSFKADVPKSCCGKLYWQVFLINADGTLCQHRLYNSGGTFKENGGVLTRLLDSSTTVLELKQVGIKMTKITDKLAIKKELKERHKVLGLRQSPARTEPDAHVCRIAVRIVDENARVICSTTTDLVYDSVKFKMPIIKEVWRSESTDHDDGSRLMVEVFGGGGHVLSDASLFVHISDGPEELDKIKVPPGKQHRTGIIKVRPNIGFSLSEVSRFFTVKLLTDFAESNAVRYNYSSMTVAGHQLLQNPSQSLQADVVPVRPQGSSTPSDSTESQLDTHNGGLLAVDPSHYADIFLPIGASSYANEAPSAPVTSMPWDVSDISGSTLEHHQAVNSSVILTPQRSTSQVPSADNHSSINISGLLQNPVENSNLQQGAPDIPETVECLSTSSSDGEDLEKHCGIPKTVGNCSPVSEQLIPCQGTQAMYSKTDHQKRCKRAADNSENFEDKDSTFVETQQKKVCNEEHSWQTGIIAEDYRYFPPGRGTASMSPQASTSLCIEMDLREVSEIRDSFTPPSSCDLDWPLTNEDPFAFFCFGSDEDV